MQTTIRCPECERLLRVPDDMVGRKVKCPTCGTTFVAEVGEEGQPSSEPGARPLRPEDTPTGPYDPVEKRVVPSAQAGRRQRTDDLRYEDEDEDDDYDEDDRPRRRSPFRGDFEDEARAAVSGPATALTVVGVIGLVLVGLNVVLTVLNVGMAAQRQGRNAGGVDEITNLASGVVGIVVSTAFSILILAGAAKMRSLTNYGLAMTACILAMLPCGGCCILGLPFGIWGLVVLNRQEVKSAFR